MKQKQPVSRKTVTRQPAARRTCVLVLGMHRSGTSALTRTLSLLGCQLPQRMWGAAEGNETGHWEPERLVSYTDQFLKELHSSWYDWKPLDLTGLSSEIRAQVKRDFQKIIEDDYGNAGLFVVKDPRICRFPTFFMETLGETAVNVSPVVIFRNPLEVFSSLEARKAFWPEGFSMADGALLWLSHVLEAERATRGYKRTLITYDALLSDWREVVSKIAKDTGIRFPAATDEVAPLVEEFLHQGLRHHARSAAEVALNPILRGWCSEAFEALIKLSANPEAKEPQSALDKIYFEFRRALPTLENLLTTVRKHAQATIEAERELRRQSDEQRDELNGKAEDLAQKLSNVQSTLSAARSEIEALTTNFQEVSAQREQVSQINEQLLSRVRVQLGVEEGDNRSLDQLVDDLIFRFNEVSKEAAEKGEGVERLEHLAEERAELLAIAKAELQELRRRASESDDAFKGFRSEIEQLQQRLAQADYRNKVLETAQAELATRETALESLQSERNDLLPELHQLDAQTKDLASAQAKLSDYEARIGGLVAERDSHRVRAEAIDHDRSQARYEEQQIRDALDAVYGSTSWKITAPIRGAKTAALRLIRIPSRLSQEVRKIPAAVRFGGGLTPSIGKALRVYREEGLSGVAWRMTYAQGQDGRRAPGPEILPSPNLQSAADSQASQHVLAQNTVVSASKVGAYVDQILSTASKKPGIELDYVPKSPQPFDVADCPIKAIAFYLPQFHPIPENDKWWGKGFTEWTNVSKAVPQFVGHYQPQLPGELGFYDLRLIDVQRQQAELAKHYGIYGFCYHHYWFGGNRLLERPVNQILANPDIDLPFCLCWANENWTRRWDGLEQDILMAQNHSPEDDLAFIADLAPALRDPRYIRFNGRPVLLVYRVSLLPDAAATAQRWRDYCRKEGIGELYLVAARTFGIKDPKPFGFDAAIEFPPHEANARCLNNELDFINPDFGGYVFSYEDMVSSHLALDTPGSAHIKTVAPGWDNEARKPGKGHVFYGASPSKYAKWLRGAIDFTLHRQSVDEAQPPFVFINAWNEWAEGAHLEPDRRFGYANLHATANVLQDYTPAQRAILEEIDECKRKFTKKSEKFIILHLYYIDLYDEILPYIKEFGELDLFISLGKGVDLSLVRKIKNDFDNVYIDIFQNKGRDVLPFLKFLQVVHNLGYSHGLKIHGKKSLQREDGDRLRRDALAALAGSTEVIEKNAHAFQQDASLGLSGPSGALLNLSAVDRNILNRGWLDYLLPKIGRADLIDRYDWDFFAGTMFWFRVPALAGLLNLGLSESDFEEELGQVDGTLAHAIERLISICCREAGYSVKSSD